MNFKNQHQISNCSFAYLFAIVLIFFPTITTKGQQQVYNLFADSLAKSWDEAMPLGNGMLGALIWERSGRLRFSLDRADLWDSRPMKGLHRDEFKFKWVQEQVQKRHYDTVQNLFDWPYDHEPAPTKIPGAAMEINSTGWGKVLTAELHIQKALCEVEWENGCRLFSFLDANQTAGFFRLEKLPGNFDINVIAPKYEGEIKIAGDPVGGDDLTRLGYKQGIVKKEYNSIHYIQEGWNGFAYKVTVIWNRLKNNTIEGAWTISSAPDKRKLENDETWLKPYLARGFAANLSAHCSWWKSFWAKSDLIVPDKQLQKQWYLEQYKFGSASRKGAPPISLQAIWTADNGRIPPWKGDYHHDLNTQLSYWPAYSANHLEEAMAYLDHLDNNKSNYRRYTKQYFETDGLNVPGVTTLDGTEMGGWIQYSLSPTVSSWLAHHYYLQWRYSMDKKFLQQRAYPWFIETARHLEQLTKINNNGIRQLPLSSSPEINDNRLSAWFLETTNYDLALMKFVFSKASELAQALGKKEEAVHWKNIEKQFPGYALSPNSELMFAPGAPYNVSHRHFSNIMAIHPLGLIKWEDGIAARRIITNTLRLLDSIGPAYWCGYSYAWLANAKARAKDGDGAARALNIFSRAFCLPNSFHVNGDQTKSGYSTMLYRPFTLEGNFAFAAGLQEMLLQSYSGIIEIMPAIPETWNEASFKTLRAEGAFLVSAEKKNGAIDFVSIFSEKGGLAKLKLPFRRWVEQKSGKLKIVNQDGDILNIQFEPGAKISFKKIS